VTTFGDRLVEHQGATGPERTPRPLINAHRDYR
jgi:hypothetical protein